MLGYWEERRRLVKRRYEGGYYIGVRHILVLVQYVYILPSWKCVLSRQLLKLVNVAGWIS